MLNVGTIILAIPTLVLASRAISFFLPKWKAAQYCYSFLVALCNALVAMPFALQQPPPFYSNMLNFQRLCLSLNLRGWQRWKLLSDQH